MSARRPTTLARVLRPLRQLVTSRRGRHSAAYLATRPASIPPPRSVPTTTGKPWPVLYEDPPTLHLPRVPVDERFPIFWDTDPAPPYVPRFFHAHRGTER